MVDNEKRLEGSPLQSRRNRLDVLGHSVPAPTNRHLDRLSTESFADYVAVLIAQSSSGAQDQHRREIALETARQKVKLELWRRMVGFV